MRVSQRRIVVSIGGKPANQPPQGALARVLGFALGTVVLVGAFVFSLVLFAVLLGVGLIAGGYVWWKTRELRRQLRESVAAARRTASGLDGEPARPGTTTIEGEFTRDPGSETMPGAQPDAAATSAARAPPRTN
jgi:hypothetical protein